jgi:hypothetical protein
MPESFRDPGPVEELADEFEENALNDLADYLREHGVAATREYVAAEIVKVRAGDDPWDPEGESLGNLEVAQDRLASFPE